MNQNFAVPFIICLWRPTIPWLSKPATLLISSAFLLCPRRSSLHWIKRHILDILFLTTNYNNIYLKMNKIKYWDFVKKKRDNERQVLIKIIANMADLLAKFDMLKLVAICFALDFRLESMSWRLCISLSVLHNSKTNLKWKSYNAFSLTMYT